MHGTEVPLYTKKIYIPLRISPYTGQYGLWWIMKNIFIQYIYAQCNIYEIPPNTAQALLWLTFPH